MSYLKDLENLETKKEPKPKKSYNTSTKVFKQKDESVITDVKIKVEKTKNLKDIPNTNIMAIGNLVGIRLRASKVNMIQNLIKYLEELIKDEVSEMQK